MRRKQLGFLLLLLAIGNESYADSARVQNLTNNHWYKRFDSSMSWHAARDYCLAQGGYLATITSLDENQFIYNQLVIPSPNTPWLGMTDEEKEGVWKWVTDEPFDYVHWAGSEPNNCRGVEDYGSMFLPNDPELRKSFWNDAGSLNSGSCGCTCPTDSSKMSFICEWATRVTGTIAIQRVAKKGRLVILKQKDEPNQTTHTDGNGNFQFENAVSGKKGSITIHLPILP